MSRFLSKEEQNLLTIGDKNTMDWIRENPDEVKKLVEEVNLIPHEHILPDDVVEKLKATMNRSSEDDFPSL